MADNDENDDAPEGLGDVPMIGEGATNLQRWDPAKAVENLAMEGRVHGEETETALAQRLSREAAPVAMLSIVHMSQNAKAETVRLRAAQYITDRVLGRIGESIDESEDGPIEQLVRQLQELGADSTK